MPKRQVSVPKREVCVPKRQVYMPKRQQLGLRGAETATFKKVPKWGVTTYSIYPTTQTDNTHIFHWGRCVGVVFKFEVENAGV